MTFYERPGGWRTEFPTQRIEIHLGGDASGPFPENVEMAQACEARLEGLLSQAVAYVAVHAAQASAVAGTPDVVAVEFGLSNYGQHREFEIFFSDDATYVLWAVRFAFRADADADAGPARCLPVGFSRRSW